MPRKSVLLASVCVVALLGCQSIRDGDSPDRAGSADGLEVEIVLPWYGGERRHARYRDEDAHVVLHNRTGDRISVWEDWNSWGYYCLRLELRDQSGRTFHIRKRSRAWTRNFPQATTVGPHGTHVLNLRLGQEVWQGLPTRPEPPEDWMPLEMRAIYENNRSRSWDEEDDIGWGMARIEGVWTGRAASEWVPVWLWQALPDPVWSRFDDL